jgi:MCM P-loop domain
MKQWSSKALAYQRLELLHLYKLGAVSLLLLIQSGEGVFFSPQPCKYFITSISRNILHQKSVVILTFRLINRYDSSKAFTENVELTDPIISRFDILCVVKVRFINSKTIKKQKVIII